MPDQPKQPATSGNDLSQATANTANTGSVENDQPSSNIVTDVAALKAQVEALHKVTDDQAALIAGLNSRLSSIESRTGSLETSVGTLHSATSNHDSKIAELESRENRSPLEDENLKALLGKYGLK